MDVRLLVRLGFEDMVADASSIEESTDMSTKLVSMIEFKGGLNLINFKEN